MGLNQRKRKGIVLIGSGPSLNRIDVGALAGCDTIAFNRSWLAWPEWGFTPTYHACLDPLSMAIIAPELPPVVAAHQDTHFFLHRDAARTGIEAGGHVTFCELGPGGSFSGSLQTLTDFGNVGAISMQLLCAMGYRDILLVGVDGDYQPESNVVRDANHFRRDYAAGRTPLTSAERARYTAGWPAVAAECGRCALVVCNASPGTALTCFPTVELSEGLAWLARSREPALGAAD